ncbi:MAG: triple tyrosine motif-containing protein, partial [Rhodanobacter sp.]
ESLARDNMYIYTSFADREGNIWLGEVGGLERLRPNKLRALAPAGKIIDPEMSLGMNGDVWVGSSQERGIYQIKGDSMIAWPSLGTGLAAISIDKVGNIWFLKNTMDANEDDIRILSNGSIKRLPYPAGSNGIYALGVANDSQGGYLLATSAGLFRLNNNVWTAGSGRSGLPSDSPNHIYSDAKGRIWLMYTNNRVAVIDGGHAKTYTAADGIAVGNVASVDVKQGDIWVAGDDGIARLEGTRFVPLMLAGNTSLRNATGVTETFQGDLWINTTGGLYKISKEELGRAELDNNYRVKATLLDQNDGLQGGLQNLLRGPSLLQSDNGRLWIARSEGVTWINPSHVLSNMVPPYTAVLSVSADGQEQGKSAFPALPALTHVVRIGYTAPLLSMPEKVTFKYRLDGVDEDWQDAGTRREATYTNLRPGNYRFHVIASNEDGLRGEQDTMELFSISPAFYQTWWFNTLCVLVTVLLTWVLIAIRIHQLQTRLRLLLTTRQKERERIARELHDTLMQSMHAVLLRVQTWADNSLIDLKIREDMSYFANLTRTVLQDGRDRILALRNSPELEPDLVFGLRDTGEEYARTYSCLFSMEQYGVPLLLQPDVLSDLFEIGRESIRNAFLHAEASMVTVILDFSRRNLMLSVRDDGIGIPNDILARGGKVGHWGLAGMHERALRIGGKLTITRCDGRGTEVVLVISSGHAYRRLFARLRMWLQRKSSTLDKSL